MTTSHLVTPGPVPVSEDTLKALGAPIIHHRTKEFETIFGRVLERLRYVFQTKHHVFVLASTGSGAMEASLVNCLNMGDHVVAVISGKFGERWAQMAEALGFKVTALIVPQGQACTPEALQAHLRANPGAKAVISQVCETSTGVLHPIQALAQVVHQESQALFMVDAVSALGAVELPMDEWNIDVIISGSQKGLSSPTGLSLIALNDRAWSAVENSRFPKFYWDLKQEKKSNKASATFFSSATSLIRALDVVLIQMEKMGLKKVFSDVTRRARATRAGIKALGLTEFPQTPSPSLTVVRVPENIDGQKIQALMQDEYQVIAMGGQDQLKGKIIRFGHMGAISDESVVASINALGLSLQKLSPQSFLTTQQIADAIEKTKIELKK